MKVILITGNKHKLRNVSLNLNAYKIKVEGFTLETPEIQSSNVKDVAEHSALYAFEKLKQPVLKMDVGFEIDALNGFPGPFIKYINEWLKPEKIIEMLNNEENRKACFVDVISYCSSPNKIKSFKMVLNGTIIDEVRGNNGWGIDKIFIPDGSKKTLAEMTDEERDSVWGGEHWSKFAKYFKKETCRITAK